MRKLINLSVLITIALLFSGLYSCSTSKTRNTLNFCKDWKFTLGDINDGQNPVFNDAKWRTLNLPHDWSIEGPFDEKNPATCGGGALPGGIGWYRKTFTIPETEKSKLIFIDFDGVYCNS